MTTRADQTANIINDMMQRKESYQARIAALTEEYANHQGRRKRLGWARLISFAVAVVLFCVLLTVSLVWAFGIAIALLLIFIFFTVSDIENLRKLQFTQELIRINEEEQMALKGDYSAFEGGVRYQNPGHPYAADLDIFGAHSLFSLVNRTTTAPSERMLADWLLHPATAAEIRQRQQSVRALAPALEWRQKIQAAGRKKNIGREDFDRITQWAATDMGVVSLKKWQYITTGAMVMTAVFTVLAALDLISWQWLWLSFALHMLIVWRSGKWIKPHYEALEKTLPSLESLAERLEWMVSRSFDDPGIQHLQSALTAQNLPAHVAVGRLKKILERLELRLNPLVHFPLNLLCFWDFQQFKSLRNWHEALHDRIDRWIKVFAEVEALSSLANLAYNEPSWCFPVLSDAYFTLHAREMGHPLIPGDKRVCNDLDCTGAGKMLLVTGSNMAGKSTFLRTVGVNIVLAMAGGPVCAGRMEVSPVGIISSMRIADNLEENISTFYAELKKLEYIISEARSQQPRLLLMDEILRGTNSIDRHAGSRALIAQLLQTQAVGILATHDLALTDMEEKYPGAVVNFHFDVQVQGEDLFFDYRLKEGICTSMNASVLMRKIGIAL